MFWPGSFGRINLVMKEDIRNFTLDELKSIVLDMGEKPHRAKQVFSWLNRKEVSSFSEMTNLSKNLIKKYTLNISLSELLALLSQILLKELL